MESMLPVWAQELKEQFCSGSVSQFIIYGNIFDVVPGTPANGSRQFMSLKKFLEEVMLDSYDSVIHYDRGKGIRVSTGDKEWADWLSSLMYDSPGALASLNTREPAKALELIDRYILRTLHLQAIKNKDAKNEKKASYKQAVIIDFSQFIVPRGDAMQLAGEIGSNVVKILSWANDPSIKSSNIATFLITEKLNDLNNLIVENPHNAKIEIKLPTENEMLDYLRWLQATQCPDLEKNSEVNLEVMAKRFSGLSRTGSRNVISQALNNDRKITADMLRKKKKEMIEKECQDLLEFLEAPFNLDFVAGHTQAKAWLKQDIELIRKNKPHTLPMGYLITGRIGTGKTFLVQCWAGELGIPCVVLKNFRDKWVGATEGNLEKIFSVLHALGEVVVFVDEADQMTGKRDGGNSDSGLSGRVYAALAKEMSDTRNRGKIIWVFATSRPDLVEVDLKRQGRLDVHIPLFTPQSQNEYHDFFLAIAKKLKFPLTKKDLPPIPDGVEFGGHEIEGMIVRSLRVFELQIEPKKPLAEIFKQVMADVKPNAYTKKLEYMDMVAVKECTDAMFLPPKYATLSPEKVERRIEELGKFM